MAWAHVLRKLVSLGASGSRQKSTPASSIRGHHALKDLDGIANGLVVGTPGSKSRCLGEPKTMSVPPRSRVASASSMR